MTNWDTIVAHDGPAVWRILWRLLANREDVEECFQETFVTALTFSRRQSVDCWPALLCSLATARGMDRLRTRYRQAAHRRDCHDVSHGRRLAEATSTDADPAEHAVAEELSERLREALSKLPERQAEVFYLHALCGWSHRELGERMRMTDNAVGVTIHRARQRLRELLNDSQ
ncbi:MAG TPA: sigma-70 family RNA polymerase sigma factor [Planctomycetaceae bacterium]|jgi:RNA polymerase sigma-70 factor (ECF subfamily)|nr:sigma-70 family RNA polymerase sigma factor [Planctomycetaceae bacterium]